MDLRPQPPTWWLTRFWFLRALGLIYLVAFVSLWWQLMPLLGSHGVLPIRVYLHNLRGAHYGFWDSPSLFWLGASDTFLRGTCFIGLVLSMAVLAGATNAVIMAALWALYLSFVHVGQIFYGYGWEILLCEAGFLAIFFCPLRSISPWRGAPSGVLPYLVRWLLFRVMFGAGLIKIRGDECWRDLTCLAYHYETQPIPNPLSWLLHQAPMWFHKLCVLFNHFVELIVPFGLFWPRRVAMVSAVLIATFQIILILSGNLSWLNWLTLSLCICCFDDRALRGKVPPELPARSTRIVSFCLCGLVALLSIAPVANLLSSHQLMNNSFEPFELVNTYGAFGSVGQVRDEVILEGSDDGNDWREYAFACAPGDLMRRPCVIAPFQPRIDWQIWFAAMSRIERQPWLLKLMAKLLEGDRGVLSLMGPSPFAHPPRLLRARLYEYHFTHFGEPGWWTRRLVREYMPPLTLDELRQVVAIDEDE
jgi:hypothetical protein